MQSPRFLLVISACAALLVSAAAVRAGDPETAIKLMESGKAALKKRKFDEAIEHLENAREEDPELIEAAYWIGAVHDKAKKPDAALAAYREFRSLVVDPNGAHKPLLIKAEKRIQSLAPGERDDKRKLDRFCAKLRKLAGKYEKTEPALAALAYEMLLRAKPGDAKALKGLERATARPPPKGTVPVPKELRELEGWTDLIKEPALGGYPGWTYKSPGIVMDTQAGQICSPSTSVYIGRAFALDMEVKLGPLHKATGGLGFAIELAEGHYASVVIARDEVQVLIKKPSAKTRKLVQAAIPTPKRSEWHRLSVVGRKNRLHVYYDGKRVLSTAVDGITEMTALAMYHNACRAQVRTLRRASLKK